LSAGELAEVHERLLQPLRIEGRIKENGVHVRGHYHVGVGAEALGAVAEIETVDDNLAGVFGHEYR